jgi:hypothetical protein
VFDGVSGGALQPSGETDKWLSNFRESRPKAPFTAAWKNGTVTVVATILTEIDRLVVADAPGWRSGKGEDMNAPPIGQIMAERTGDGVLSSGFAAVIAPYTGERSPVLSARLIAGGGADSFMAVEVALDGRTDYILSSPGGGTHDCGAAALSGRFGFASLDRAGKLSRAYLLAGTELRTGGKSVKLEKGVIPLETAGVSGRSIALGAPLPKGIDPVGKYILSGGTGFEVESAKSSSLTVREYPVKDTKDAVLLNSTSYERK